MYGNNELIICILYIKKLMQVLMFIDFGDLYVYGICVVCKCYNNKYF